MEPHSHSGVLTAGDKPRPSSGLGSTGYVKTKLGVMAAPALPPRQHPVFEARRKRGGWWVVVAGLVIAAGIALVIVLAS